MSVTMIGGRTERTKMAHNSRKAWARLGDQLTARRGELGYGGFRKRAAFARDRGAGRMSYRNFTRVETGERDYYPPETLDTIADIYEVTRASVRAVLDGSGGLVPAGGSAATPKPGILAAGDVASPANPGSEEPLRYEDPAEQYIADTPGLTREEAEVFIAMYRAIRATGSETRRTGS